MNTTLSLILTVFLLLLNAFFVAGEFATTSARRSQIEPLHNLKYRGSSQAMYALEHISLMLAICQLGITVASTSLGFVAEPILASIIEKPIAAINIPESSLHIISFSLALLLVLFLHVVFGEMVPKNISISMPDKALLFLAPPLVFVGYLLRPLIIAMDNTANWFLKINKITPKTEISAVFTADEVASIVEASQAKGTINDDIGLLSGSLEFSNKIVQDVMVPVSNLVILPEDVTPNALSAQVAKTGYSRFPISNKNNEIIGYLHLKDILYAQDDQYYQPVNYWRIRRMESVKPSDEIEVSLRQMQRGSAHCAKVIDKNQHVIGVLFLEDILEELIGEIRDSLQHD